MQSARSSLPKINLSGLASTLPPAAKETSGEILASVLASSFAPFLARETICSLAVLAHFVALAMR